MNLSIFILAAGIGERLRPITDYIPKPLLPILGNPVLKTLLERISNLPYKKIGINLYHKKEHIKNWIEQSEFNTKIELFLEEHILGTGGALKNAEDFLKNSIFLVHNSDIISEIDLKKFISFHCSSENLVTLAVRNYPEFNKLVINKNGLLKGILGKNIQKRIKEEHLKYTAFTGIAVYCPEFLTFLPNGTSSVVDAWLKALKAGYKIGTFDVSSCYWIDIGTPTSYAKAIIEKMRKNGETVYIHPASKGCNHVDMDGYVVIEKGCSFKKGISLRNCIILPGTNISITKENSQRCKGIFENCILGPGFKIKLTESEMLSSKENNNSFLIGAGGSNRKFYRISRYKKNYVLMQCPSVDTEFQRYIQYTNFFQKHSVPVPNLIKINPTTVSIIIEDLGDISLYSWLKCEREIKQIEKIYRKVIDILVLLHTIPKQKISKCTLLKNTIFDYKHLRWETEYFLERFVKGIKNIKLSNLSALDDEFHRLATIVDSFPKTVIHRDFQSQNIMITKGGIPRLLDYQGARIGPPAYDVVSILWDPYYHLEDDIREKLLDYYISKINRKGSFKKLEIFNKEFRETLLPCRLQRHMQALGAYGFLSRIKGKEYFLKFVPEGLRLLKEDILLSKDDYPLLYKLIMKL